MKRRKSYTAAFKLDAVNYRDLHGTLAAASHFEVTEAMIRKWVVGRQNLQEMPATKRARRYKKPSVEEVEDAIYNWVVKKREENRAVTVKEIRTKAKELAEEHGHQNFKASAHCCILFMARKKLSVRRRISVGQPLPSDHLQKCSDFRKFVAAEALNVSPFNLGNIDEVPVPFDIIYERTVDVKGRESIKIDSTGHEKSNFTVVLGVTAAGEKLKPMLIFKKKLMPKGQFPPDVIVKTNEKGWMSQELMKEWIVEVWNKRENHNSDPDRSLLIFDSARYHVTDEVKQFCQQYSKIAVIPGGLTKILQPLDVGINKPFKDHLKAGWEKWMRNEAKATYTKSGIRRRMS
ncbi:hypothetical protein RB195_022106 [Necator americanus]|uniref:HTH CENPB-type domain-containing protein n=1 Tax=Necator americanus TaxID=51031 RepID=A0ABR1EE21_NECAM